jgi:drug/metabolite transporter (DMT)-like permease
VVGILDAAGWPDFPLLFVAFVFQVVGVMVWLIASKPALPKCQLCKWVVFAGISFVGSAVLMIFAVRMGVPLGDFAALNSVNVVFAAFLGRIFLKEALHWVHFLAVLSSLVGALLISKPAAIFGRNKEDDTAWIGYILSLGSGLADACIYISSRKCVGAPSGYELLSFTLQGSIAMFAVIPLVASPQTALAPFLNSPWEAFAWVTALSFISLVSLVMFSFAAQWCPAAVSATVDTATRMTTGYAAQVLLFSATLDPFTLGGAALMLASVIFMSLAQVPVPSKETPHGQQQVVSGALESSVPHESQNLDNDSDDIDSLASFVAAEFAGTSQRSVALRLRHFAGSSADLLARTLGAVAIAALPASA